MVLYLVVSPLRVRLCIDPRCNQKANPSVEGARAVGDSPCSGGGAARGPQYDCCVALIMKLCVAHRHYGARLAVARTAPTANRSPMLAWALPTKLRPDRVSAAARPGSCFAADALVNQMEIRCEVPSAVSSTVTTTIGYVFLMLFPAAVASSRDPKERFV